MAHAARAESSTEAVLASANLPTPVRKLRDEAWQLYKGWSRLGVYTLQSKLGQRNGLKVLHYDISNWGDAVNPSFVEMISGQPVCSFDIDAKRAGPLPKPDSTETVYSVVGSILQHADSETVVWGSGFQGPGMNTRQVPRAVTAVRGPLTARRLQEIGVSCPDVYGDPVLLLPRYYRPPTRKRYRLGLVPHRKDFTDPLLAKYRNNDEVSIVDMRGPLWATVNAVCECENVVSSSLHGLVLADAYGVPSAWARISDRIPGGDFKFKDYYGSLGLSTEIAPLDLQTKTVDELVAAATLKQVSLDLDRLLENCPFRPA
jgi:pyruvyltransferase